MSLPGVKVGPLDPEATSEFGQVAAHNSARTLLRLHRQMYPPQFRRVLARPRDEELSAGLDLDEVREYLGGLSHPNGDAVIPEGARVVGAAVAGDELTGRVLRFQYELPTGRIGKWFADYDEERLPTSFEQGRERARVKEMKDRGVVAYDDGGTQSEILRRRLAASQQENERLRAQSEGRDADAEADDSGKVSGAGGRDEQGQAGQLGELEELRRTVEELTRRNAELETLAATAGGQGLMPTGGLEGDIPDRDAQARAPEADGDEVAEDDAGGAGPQQPPHEGYDELRAPDVVSRIKSDETSDDEVRAILEYERGHANRATVTSAAEQRLDRAGG